ncbi:hypothetical protein HMI55_002552 [Coelomomyces lativittatus]|nr:hypothetical protein HMI55_002552 [Coelomomyces lativittatus]
MSSSTTTYLILGGLGFIGRNLVSYLLHSGVTPSNIRVVDKVLPSTAWLNEGHQVSINQVDFKQANLVNPGNLKKKRNTTVSVENIKEKKKKKLTQLNSTVYCPRYFSLYYFVH